MSLFGPPFSPVIFVNAQYVGVLRDEHGDLPAGVFLYARHDDVELLDRINDGLRMADWTAP